MSNSAPESPETPEEVAELAEHTAQAEEAGQPDDTTDEPDEPSTPGLPADDTAEQATEIPPAPIALTPEQVLQHSVDDLSARLRTVSAAYREQQEEMKASRERLERQGQVKEEMRRGEVVAALFDPFQNLRRSIEAMHKGASTEEAVAGLEMVEKQTLQAFHQLGLEEVPGKGAIFDPNLHEAISIVPVTDAALDEVIVEVFSAGYRLGSRLIQPARVVIGRLTEAAGEA